MTDQTSARAVIIGNAMIIRTGPAEIVERLDANDRAYGIVRVNTRDQEEATLERVAEALALQGDEDDCFRTVREYQALTVPEKRDYDEAHGFPTSELESCNYWRKKAKAALAALR